MDQQKKVAFININPCPALPAKTFNRVKKCEVALMVFRGKSAVVPGLRGEMINKVSGGLMF